MHISHYSLSLFTKIPWYLYILVSFPFFLVLGPAVAESAVLIIFLIYLFREKKLKFLNESIIKYLLFFYFYLLVNCIINFSNFEIFLKSLLLVRFLFYIICFSFFFKNYQNLFKIFLFFLIILISVIFLDSIIQYFSDDKSNILGFITPEPNDRLSSFFNEEMVLGSFIVRISPIFIIAYLLYEKKIYLLSFIFSLILIILSGERTSIGLLIVFILINFFNKGISLKPKIIITISALFVFSYLMISNVNYINRYFKLTISEFGQKQVVFFTPKHNSLYFTGLNMFKDKIWFGHGYKSFRKKCNYEKYSFNSESCSTHPHSYVVQMLSEFGILGCLIYFVGIFYLIKNIFYSLFREINKENSILFVINSNLLINFFPFLPSGNIFNNWLMYLNLFPLIIYFWFVKNNQLDKKLK